VKAQGKGVTLVELLVVVLIVGVMALITIPRFSMATAEAGSAQAAAEKIAAGVRYARSLAIANAATNTKGFALNMTGPSTGYTGFQIVNLSNGSIVKTETIAAGVKCVGASSFNFGIIGNRLKDTDSLTVSGGGKTYIITVISATGMVQCQQK
jgi:prepilin-type N-terminal cleavage/methylation domain-containing protein